MNLVSIAWWRTVFTRFGTGCVILMMITLVIGFGWNQFASRSNNPNTGQVQRDAVALTVNGQNVTQGQVQGVLAALQQQSPSSSPTDFARLQGQALMGTVQGAVIEQLAHEQNVRPADADIDRVIASERERALPKGASDAEWESYVLQRHGVTAPEYRDQIARDPQMLAVSLFNAARDKEKVTDDEAKNQTTQVRLTVVLIPTLGGMSLPNQTVKPLADADAKKKADDLQTKAKGGADIAALAKANSGDMMPATKSGDTGLLPEYGPGQSLPGMGDPGSLRHGTAFDEAVHKTPVGQITDVVRAEGFQKGYVFAKVVDRQNTLPKDFDVKKAVTALKQERAQKKVVDLIQQRVKVARVDVKDPDKKPYYDYTKFQSDQMGQFGASAPTPKAERDKQQADLDAEFEALLKRHPDDATAAAIVAASLEQRKATAPDTNDRLIALYNVILKTNEDRAIRFKLAGLYQKKGQNADALTQYDKIARYLGYNPPYDSASINDSIKAYQDLETGYRAVAQPDKAAGITAKIQELNTQLAVETAKEQAAQKNGANPGMLSLPPGSSTTVQETAPSKGTSAPSKVPAPASKPTGGGSASGLLSPNTGSHSTANPGTHGGGSAPSPSGSKQ